MIFAQKRNRHSNLQCRNHCTFCIRGNRIWLDQSFCQHFRIKFLENIFIIHIFEDCRLHRDIYTSNKQLAMTKNQYFYQLVNHFIDFAFFYNLISFLQKHICEFRQKFRTFPGRSFFCTILIDNTSHRLFREK